MDKRCVELANAVDAFGLARTRGNLKRASEICEAFTQDVASGALVITPDERWVGQIALLKMTALTSPAAVRLLGEFETEH